jgi:hypothetical protein
MAQNAMHGVHRQRQNIVKVGRQLLRKREEEKKEVREANEGHISFWLLFLSLQF